MLYSKPNITATIFLLFVLFMGMAIPAGLSTAAAAFSDIADSYANNEIEALAEEGIVSGYEDGTFRPRQKMTRAELAKLISLAAGLKENPEKAAAFADVPETSWYRGYVGALVESGITQGTSPTSFSPNTSVTREELVVFFVRTMGLEETAQKLVGGVELTDFAKVSVWAKAHVALSYRIGFVNGISNPDGTLRFGPQEKAERQALARLAYAFKANKSVYAGKAHVLLTSDDDETEESAPGTPTPSTPSPATPSPSASTGGGAGGDNSGGSGETPTSKSILESGGTYNGNLTLGEGGTFGPSEGRTTINGTLILNPGENGTVLLQNVTATDIEVQSGDDRSIKLKGITIIRSLRVNAVHNSSKSVRIQSLAGTNVGRTDVRSKVIIESTDGSLGDITVGPAAAGKEIEMRGQITGKVTLEAEGAKLKLAPAADGGPTTVTDLRVAAGATITVPENTTLQSVTLSAKADVIMDGSGTVQTFTVSEAAEGSVVTVTRGTGLRNLVVDAPVKIAGDVEALNIEIAKPGVTIDTTELDPQTLQALISHAVGSAESAIDQLGVITLEKEPAVRSARSKANAALALGAAESQIGNLTALAAAETKIAELKASSGLKIESVTANGSAVNVTLNRSVTATGYSVAKAVYTVTAAAYEFHTGIWPYPGDKQESDSQLPLTGISGPGATGNDYTLAFESSVTRQYVVKLYTGTAGLPDFRIVAESRSFTVGEAEPEPQPFIVSSEAFAEGDSIPDRYAKEPYGSNASIPVAWSNAPEGTQSFALIMYDPLAPDFNFVHWAVVNIPASANSIWENASLTSSMPEGSVELKNDFGFGAGSIGYGGPQPPASPDRETGTHRYKLVVYALQSDAVDVQKESFYSYDEFQRLLDGKIIAQAETTGTYFVQSAPPITGFRLAPGTVPGATAITFDHAPEHRLRVVPDMADNYKAPIGKPPVNGTAAYTSGQDLTGVQAGRHIGLFEVDEAGNVVKYAAVLIAADHIRSQEDSVTLEYLGHSSFILTKGETKVLIDPWWSGMFGLPGYELTDEASVDFVTVSHNHEDHNNAGAAPTAKQAGSILYGVDSSDFWQPEFVAIDTVAGDFKVKTVNAPHFQEGSFLRDGNPNAAFVFESDTLRIVHFGDGMGPILNGLKPDEIAALTSGGGIDVLLIPTGESMMGALDRNKVLAAIRALNPAVAIPIHQWKEKQTFLDAASSDGLLIFNKESAMMFGSADLPQGNTVIWNMSSYSDVPMPNTFASASVTSDAASFTFTLPPGTTGVKLLQSADEGSSWTESVSDTLNAASTAVTATGLQPGTLYKFKLKVELGPYAGFSNEAYASTKPLQGHIPSEAAIMHNIAGKLGLTAQDRKVEALTNIDAAELYSYNTIEVFNGWGQPNEFSVWTKSAEITGGIEAGTALLTLENVSPGNPVWYRLSDGKGM